MSRSSSEVVDSKVVEMSLENSNFEKNATTSLSTLQKLKEALNFTTSKDGLDGFSHSLRRIDFNPMNAGIAAAQQGISALDAVSFGFFSRIGGQIEQIAHQYATMFTSKPIRDGFAEYELKMGSVQTILMGAHTKEGLPVTLDLVNQKLEELNAYSDKTIYSFSDMTSNIGKFTNAGVDLDSAVAAIQGISNAAALAGANSQQASHAMYNFAQALSSGYVKLIDWKSIENANMATVEFKQTLIDTALELGTISKEGDKFVTTTTNAKGQVSEAFDSMMGFNDSLSFQWMTTDVLTAALARYSDETDEIGKKAFKAATEVKTFSQLMDTLQEAAGSGWAQTWELIIGDFDQAKSLFTLLSDTFGGIIDAQSKARNEILKEGLGEQSQVVSREYLKNLDMTGRQTKVLYKALMEVGKANGVAFESDNYVGFLKSLESGWLSVDMLKTSMEELNSTGVDGEGMSKSLDEINEAAFRVIRGEFGNDMPKRIEQLNEEGFDGEKIQEYVNEIHKLTGGSWLASDAILAEAAANVGLNETLKESSANYDDIIGKLDSKSLKKSGRELLIDSIVTSLFAFKQIASSIKGAWDDVFPPATADTVYGIAAAINQASKSLRRFALKNAERIGLVFRAIFSAFDLVLKVGTRLIKSVFNILGRLFKSTEGPAGSFIEKLANMVITLHEWAVQNEIVEKTFTKVEAAIMAVAGLIGDWFAAFMKIPQVENVVSSFGETFTYIYENFSGILTGIQSKLGKFSDMISKAFSSASTPAEFFEGIKEAFKQLWTDISSSEVMARLKESFGVLKENIKSYINDLGNNDDGSRNVFGKIIDAAVKFKTSIGNILRGVDEEGNKIDIFAGIKEAFSNLWADISASGIGGKIKEALSSVWTAIDSFFSSLGRDEEGNLNIFGQIWETVRNGLTWIYEKAAAAKTAIHDFFAEYKLGEFFSSVFDSISTAAKDFFGKLPGFVKGAAGKFGEFIEKVKSLGGIKFDNLGDIWASFKETIGQYFKDNNIFQPIVTAFTRVKWKIIAKLKEFGVDILGIKDKIVGFFTGIVDAVKNFSIPDAFDGFIKFFLRSDVDDGVTTFGDVIYGLFEKLKAFVGGLDAGKITGIVAALLAFKGLMFIGHLVKPIEALISAMAKEKKAKANFLNKAAMLEMAASIALLAVVIRILATLELPELFKGIGAIAAILIMFGIFSAAVSKMNAKNMMAAAAMISSIAGSLIVLIIAIKLLGSMIVDDFGRTLAGIGGLVVLVLGLYALSKVMSKIGGKDNLQNSAGLLAMVGSLFGLLVLIQLVTAMPLTKILKGLGKLILIAGVLAVMMWAMKKATGDGLQIAIGIAGLAACILAISIALKILATIEPDRLAYSVAALGLMMLALAAVVYTAKGLEKGLGVMVGLAAVILALATALAILSLIKPERLAAPVAALGILLGMIALLSGITGAMKPALSSLLMMVILVATIGTVLFLLSTLPDTDAVIKIATALGLIFVGLGIAMYGAVAAGSAAGVALVGLLVMVAFIAAFTALAWAIGKLGGEQKDTIQTGLDIIVAVLGGLGKAVGAFFAGIATELFDALPQIGEDITGFMSALKPLNEIGMVDIGPLAEAIGSILAISAVGFADSLLSIATEFTEGKTAAQTVADDMVALSTAFSTYATTMSSFEGITIDTQPLLDAVDAVLSASLAGFVDGLASIVTEATQSKSAVQLVSADMVTLAGAFSTYATTMASFDGIEIDTTALDDIIDIIGEISLQGLLTSLASLILGEEDKTQVQQFAEDMGTLSTALVDWQAKMAPLEGLTVPTEDINKLKTALDSIKEGGILDSVLGFFGVDTKPDYTSFTEGIKGLGGAINDFANSLGEDFDSAKMTTATDAIKKLSEVGVALGDVDFGGWFHDGVLVNFAQELVKIVPDLNTFSGSFDDTEKFASIASATRDLATGAAALTHVTFSSGDLTDSELVSTVSENVKTLKTMVESLSGIDTSGVTSFTSALSSINTVDISSAAKQLAKAKSADSNAGKGLTKSIVDGIDSKSIKSGISSALSDAMSGLDTSGYNGVGISLGTQIGLGILKSAATIKTAVSTVVKSGKNEAESYKPAFKNAGANFDLGLIEGMNQNRALVITAAAHVAAKALEAAKQRLDIHSPSREMAKVGRFFDLGFARGINNFSSVVYDESSSMATLAMDGVRKAAESAVGLLEGTGYQPVITPILDLSQMRSDASQINGLFDTSPDIMGNFTAISTNADAIRRQNSNADILSALENLGNSLGSSRPGDTYNVNGVTYDDGTNMANVVRAMIREARIERRA